MSEAGTMAIDAVVFDAYGTLFDIYSIAAQAERIFPGQGQALALLWRAKQIEYTHLRTMSAMYKPLWEVTQDALVFCCKQLRLDLSLEANSLLMGQYARLPAFPEALEVLQALRARGMKLAILSNGNPQMLSNAVAAAGMHTVFHHLLSVDSVKKFKTAPEAYQLAPDVFGVPVKRILFVSSNSWDACCATWFGYTTFWVNRSAAPLDELGVTPHGSGRTLSDLLPFLDAA